MSWAFWAVSPEGDVGGVLKADWVTVEEDKLAYIRSAMAPIPTYFDPNLPIAPPSNKTYIVSSPTAEPTAVGPPLQYYHTVGSQIVDKNSLPVRFMGINWLVSVQNLF